MIHFEHHPGKRSKHSAIAAAAVSAATIATIAAIANDVGSQQWQWQWWGKATVEKTEAVVGAHNNQPTDGSAAMAAAAVAAAVATAAMAATEAVQTVAAATAAHEIYIKKMWKRRP